LTPHDRFHPPTSADPWWTETSWFSFGDPEQGLAGTFYPLFRKNLGVAALTVAVWDERAAAPWQVPYHRAHWHLTGRLGLGRLGQGQGHGIGLARRFRHRCRRLKRCQNQGPPLECAPSVQQHCRRLAAWTRASASPR